MSRLTKEIRNNLKAESKEWESIIAKESPDQVQKLLDKAETFKVPCPARQPVSLRLDPFDVSMVNALPIRKVFHTRNSWPSGYTKGSTKKRKLLLNESPKALACGVFESKKCRVIDRGVGSKIT